MTVFKICKPDADHLIGIFLGVLMFVGPIESVFHKIYSKGFPYRYVITKSKVPGCGVECTLYI